MRRCLRNRKSTFRGLIFCDCVFPSVRMNVKAILDGLDKMTACPKEHVPLLPRLQQLSSQYLSRNTLQGIIGNLLIKNIKEHIFLVFAT